MRAKRLATNRESATELSRMGRPKNGGGLATPQASGPEGAKPRTGEIPRFS